VFHGFGGLGRELYQINEPTASIATSPTPAPTASHFNAKRFQFQVTSIVLGVLIHYSPTSNHGGLHCSR